ncbi:MAG TPA: CRTAC1 family protein, partial [Myxococcales bacterium]|nr:CRTAC1 family protein [Myxococcales bacterium]
SAAQEPEPDVGDAPEITEADIPPRPQCVFFEFTETVHYEPGQACRQGAPAPGVFTDSAAQLGINFVHNGFPPPDRHSNTDWGLEDFAGVAIADLDHDGLLDIYFTNGGGSDHLYLSLCQEIGRYYLKTLSGKNTSRVVTAADLDGDGDRDLAIVTQSEPVWRKNNGQGVFGAPSPLIAAKTDITYSTFSLALGDLTGDGLLDIYLGNHEEYGVGNTPPMPGHEQLLINKGGGVFENQSSWIPKLAIDDLTFIAALIDLDNDGDLDVYEVNDAVPFEQLGLPNFPGFGEGAGNRLLRNDGMQNGKLKLVDVTKGSGADVVVPGMGVAVGDYDNDGLVDLYVSTILPDPDVLLHNDGDLKFSDTTVAMNADTMTDEHDVAWGTVFFDADMDGWLDLFVIHGFKETWVPELRTNRDDQANVLLKNLQGKGFEDISIQAGVAGTAWSRSPAVGDLNRDGFPDLIVGNTDEAPYVYLNGCDGRPWLTVRLNKSGPNSDGIGARIVVKSNELTQTRIINPGSHGLYGSSAPEAYFGFPEGTNKVTVTVHWPDKTTSEWPDTAVKQIMTIRQ